MTGRILASRVIVAVVRGYQRYISPLFPPRCRFYPTCSEYTAIAVQEHGAIRGVVLGIGRLSRCHPFHPGGYDPVPPARAVGVGRSRVSSTSTTGRVS
jgi:putative membrane protein insertion efficiency factor